MLGRSMLLALTIACACTAGGSGEPPLKWERVTGDAGWRPRDSSGEAVFQGRLWILGGWFDSFQAAPRDVWSSADGKTWDLVHSEAPWKHSDLPMTLAFKDRMWTMGGWYNGRLPDHSAGSEVWSSEDGKRWSQATAKAPWGPRLAAGAVVFRGKMWILGGTENYYFGTEKSLRNDVWSSSDGKTWRLATANAGWSPRAYHQAVVLGDRMYVMGGGNYVPQYEATNDVWSSKDGVHWEQMTANAPWNPRLWFSAVAYKDRLWVLGGWSNNPAKNWNDVWHSRNGRDWTQAKCDVIWKERHEHSAYVFRDRLWVAGGHAAPLSNEVWSLRVAPNQLETP
ncbi:MAG: Kelch repeat-containing protein [Actinomycetota bacterium]